MTDAWKHCPTHGADPDPNAWACPLCMREAREALRAAESAAPREPTEAMLEAALVASRQHGEIEPGTGPALPMGYELYAARLIYRAMVAAAPDSAAPLPTEPCNCERYRRLRHTWLCPVHGGVDGSHLVDDDAQPAAQPDTRGEAREVRSLYDELLLAVGNKHAGESRHQTALRYIRQAEHPAAAPQGEATDTRGEARELEEASDLAQQIHVRIKRPGAASHGLVGNLRCILDHVIESAAAPQGEAQAAPGERTKPHAFLEVHAGRFCGLCGNQPAHAIHAAEGRADPSREDVKP